jgi:outer membrane lipoprotein LolB
MRYQRNIAIIILSAILLFLEGCTNLQKSLFFEPVLQDERQTSLKQITNWEIDGVLSITRGKKRDTARFKWLQKHDSYTINVSGPFNIGGVHIIGDADNVEFCRTRKKCIKASTPEQLALSQLGWQFPISNIRYWILTLPVPCIKVDAASIDRYGHLTDLNQSGWQIKYSKFQTANTENNIDLPKIIELTNKEIVIKIVIIQHKHIFTPLFRSLNCSMSNHPFLYNTISLL